MRKKASDKKLNRLSTILEIITNFGTIASWVLGVGSAYLLNVQKTPVVVPGIDFTLDLGFQFALLISAMLGYIHFLQKYWGKNAEKLKLSGSFIDFSFWDLPRLKQPLLLIPIVIAFPIFIQVSMNSFTLLSIFLSIMILVGYFVVRKFRYYLSPNRKYEKLIDEWMNDGEWFEKWSKRIKNKLAMFIAVRESDLYESGMTKNKANSLEIISALHYYFEKYEFEDNLVLIRLGELHHLHPLHTYTSDDWALMPRRNLELRNPEQ